MLNERGSMLVDAMMALLLIALMIMLLTASLYSHLKVMNKVDGGKNEDTLYEIYTYATRIYDD